MSIIVLTWSGHYDRQCLSFMGLSTAQNIEADIAAEPFEELVDYLGRLLAEEYISLMRKGENDESSNLCTVLEREPEAGEH